MVVADQQTILWVNRLARYTRGVTARPHRRWLAVLILIALTGRAASGIACLLPCDALPTTVSGTTAEHCASDTPGASDTISSEHACDMVHGEIDPAALRASERLSVVEMPAHLFSKVAVPTFPSESATPSALLYGGTHARPGKPRPLRV